MDFNEYEEKIRETAGFDDKPFEYKLMYIGLGLTGEAGEVAEKIKKVMRNDNGVVSEEKREKIKSEIGDVLWYLAQLSRTLGFSLEDAARGNITKVLDRQARDAINSEGDER